MYAKRIRLINYGPIDQLDIAFPLNGTTPKPVLFVGENGSGKSILLSHLVNGMLAAQGVAFPEVPEVQEGKVYKLRSSSYIKSEGDFYFARVDFEDDLHIGELRLRRGKQNYSGVPTDLSEADAQEMWDKMDPEESDHFASDFFSKRKEIESIFSKNCVLYFPPNRFEEPAWLNQKNLNATAQFMDLEHLQGYTNRKVINYSPLSDNQNWLFDVIYDRSVFEIQTSGVPFPIQNSNSTLSLPVFAGYAGNATSIYETALQMVQSITKNQNARFGIGGRLARTVSLIGETERIVPNIFQLSSGETSLLNLFLSILRDFDLTGAQLGRAEDIRGIVIVDEVDLHLHADHQYEILPNLIRMFPKVQFIVTTHSPLFVLGMQKTFGEDGLALYRLPQGQQISPEEFSEFGSAYQSFTETGRFSEDIRQAIENSRKPVVFVEGETDIKYIQRAAELLEQQEMLSEIQLWDGNGYGGLARISKHFDSKLAEITPQDIILLYDCDKPKCKSDGNVYSRHVPRQEDHPLDKGIENLFSRSTLQRARESKEAFIDITTEHTETIRGEYRTIPEKWAINTDEKTNLCDWLCENGTVEDFRSFQCVFDLLEELLDIGSPTKAEQAQDPVQKLPSP
ncbi:MAG: AAA family ATPase [Caldilineaceae bacterium]|nr:AAA family ATPase [Caldilineaceae bacterium]